jgi:hypothetical protein
LGRNGSDDVVVAKLDVKGNIIGLLLQQEEYDVAGLHERPIIDVMARERER